MVHDVGSGDDGGGCICGDDTEALMLALVGLMVWLGRHRKDCGGDNSNNNGQER